jgi:hypothetical protein
MSASRPWWLLVVVALAACAATPRGSEKAGCEESAELVSYEEACSHESSLEAFCAGEQCGLYRCWQVQELLAQGRVVLARASVGALPNPQLGAQRNWGSAQELPPDTRPVFIIPWKHKPPLLPSQQQMLEEAAQERAKPHEQHHIFPRMFKGWFTQQRIDIDEYVILLEVGKHRSIHRGVNGGPSTDTRDNSSTSSSCSALSFRIRDSRHHCLLGTRANAILLALSPPVPASFRRI